MRLSKRLEAMQEQQHELELRFNRLVSERDANVKRAEDQLRRLDRLNFSLAVRRCDHDTIPLAWQPTDANRLEVLGNS